MNFFLNPFKLIWKHRSLLFQTTRNDIRARYAGSTLGLIWLFLYPLLFLGAYALMYIYVFKVRFNTLNSNEYVALIFCGLIPFIGFSEALSSGVGSVVGNATLIKNTLFPIELIPVKTILVSQSTQVVGTGMLMIALIFFGKLSPFTLMLPVIWACQILFSMGLIWILSSLTVYLRDIQNIIGVVILLLMMVSPIAYTAEMVPANLRSVLYINPLYYMIISYQDTLMLGKFPSSTFGVLLGMAIGFFWVGYWFFMRMKSVFADNV